MVESTCTTPKAINFGAKGGDALVVFREEYRNVRRGRMTAIHVYHLKNKNLQQQPKHSNMVIDNKKLSGNIWNGSILLRYVSVISIGLLVF